MIQARCRAYAVVTKISTGTFGNYVQVGDVVKMTEELKEISANVLIEAMQDPVMVLDSRGLIAVQNAACRKLLGYALRDIVGKHLLDCVLASTYSLKELRSEKRNFNSAIKEDKGFVFEYQFAGKEGKSIHVLLSGSMLKDARKRTTHIIALLRDITARKKAEEELRKHRDHLEELVRERTVEVDNLQRYTRELIEVNLDPLTTFNRDGVILDVNEAIVRATGRARDELIGTPFVDYFTNSERAHNCVITVFETGEVRDYELVMKSQDKAEIVVVCNASVYRNQVGQVAGAFLAARDITERKGLETKLLQKERLAILGQLSAGVGHELRNPLGVINNAVFFLRMVFEEPEPEIRETLEILETEVATSDRIISNLLDYARSKPPTPSKMDINEAVQTALSSVKVPENITVVTQLDKALPTIQADPNQLGQVFMNLALNAIQAMPAGGQLTIKSKGEGPDWVSVSIADTGVGISVEDMEKLFEPLFTTKATGIGLGLAISKTIVDGHEGTIEVESELGKGSVFFVRLPTRTKEED